MKALNPFRETPGLCGPASLKILLSHYGKDYTEAELASLCESTTEHGTDHDKLLRTLVEVGFDAIAKDHATISDIKQLTDDDIPVIVGWFSEDTDHFSVAYDVTDTTISLMDPELDEGIRQMSIPDFEKVWYDFDGPKNVRVERWMAAISGDHATE